MIQDPQLSLRGDLKVTEGYDAVREYFLDGPIIENVAVLEFDPVTDEIKPGAHFNKGKIRGWYENGKGENLNKDRDARLYEAEFMQVSVFASVLKTIDLFTKADTLGRELVWAFPGSQLFIIPRAGEMYNAFYHRDSHSLQFFFATNEKTKKTLFTCLSRDIVAHETGHAIIDGIAPDLLDSATPQSLAIHEALADITAMLMAFSSHNLRPYILKKGKGSIKGVHPNPFTDIAEEFGTERGHEHGLRTLDNQATLDRKAGKNYVGRTEPHTLSLVLSGALFDLTYSIHEDLKLQAAQDPKFVDKEDSEFSASGYALSKAAERCKRMTFRALDYLPPGEVSYADFGRAMMAVDRAAYPADPKMREWISESFVKRHIVPDRSPLDTEQHLECPELRQLDMNTLVYSDWVAHEFASANRPLLGIPRDIPFQVRPRLEVRKEYDNDHQVRECIFKVAWEHLEDNPLGSRYPGKRSLTVGTTLAIDWDTGCIFAKLTNAPPDKDMTEGEDPSVHKRRMDEYEDQRKDRDEFLRLLASNGLLKIGRNALGPDGKPLLTEVRAEVSEGAMRLRAAGNMLYVYGGKSWIK